MALIEMQIFSKSLMRIVPVRVILPVDKYTDEKEDEAKEKKYPALYLFHGIYGGSGDWVNGTRIQRYAEEHDLAVIMPSGDNAWYVDYPESHNFYGEFVGRELVELTRRMFPLSRKKEETFIGGLSMGGYGALRNGLKYHDTFGAIISLSGAFVVEDLADRTNDAPPERFLERRDYAEHCFGDLEKVQTSDKNPAFLATQMAESGKEFPDIYLACGEQDDLLKKNEKMAMHLKKCGVPVKYETGNGGHEWDFWDAYIKKAILWLETRKKEENKNA